MRSLSSSLATGMSLDTGMFSPGCRFWSQGILQQVKGGSARCGTEGAPGLEEDVAGGQRQPAFSVDSHVKHVRTIRGGGGRVQINA